MNHLLRELAPLSSAAWVEVSEEAARALTHFLTARRIVDVDGPEGRELASVDTGRVDVVDAPDAAGAEASPELPAAQVRVRRVQPMVEVRVPFTLERVEIEAVDRGRGDGADFGAAAEAARRMAAIEDRAVFDGLEAAGIAGILPSAGNALSMPDDVTQLPERVAEGLALLGEAGVDGPYQLLLGPRHDAQVRTHLDEGGEPIVKRLMRLLDGGDVIWAPVLDDAVLVSTRGGDATISLGEACTIGYSRHDEDSVQLYLQQSFTARVTGPEAYVVLARNR